MEWEADRWGHYPPNEEFAKETPYCLFLKGHRGQLSFEQHLQNALHNDAAIALAITRVSNQFLIPREQCHLLAKALKNHTPEEVFESVLQCKEFHKVAPIEQLIHNFFHIMDNEGRYKSHVGSFYKATYLYRASEYDDSESDCMHFDAAIIHATLAAMFNVQAYEKLIYDEFPRLMAIETIDTPEGLMLRRFLRSYAIKPVSRGPLGTCPVVLPRIDVNDPAKPFIKPILDRFMENSFFCSCVALDVLAQQKRLLELPTPILETEEFRELHDLFKALMRFYEEVHEEPATFKLWEDCNDDSPCLRVCHKLHKYEDDTNILSLHYKALYLLQDVWNAHLQDRYYPEDSESV